MTRWIFAAPAACGKLPAKSASVSVPAPKAKPAQTLWYDRERAERSATFSTLWKFCRKPWTERNRRAVRQRGTKPSAAGQVPRGATRLVPVTQWSVPEWFTTEYSQL